MKNSVLGINLSDPSNMTVLSTYTLCVGQKVECRIVAGQEVTFKVDGKLVLKSTKLNIIDADLKNIKFGILNYYKDNVVKVNTIKSSSKLGMSSKDLPSEPWFFNTKGDHLEKNFKYPET
mmetsp:Transcript_69552/g.149914  ORF Transcript_69552/g.149914 Transcript_69552/m.149914 type:complete len:120 (+) Transcript_69552:1858-2217(+)